MKVLTLILFFSFSCSLFSQSEFEEINKKLVENLNKPTKIWVQGKWETQQNGTKKWKSGHWIFREKSFQKKSEILRTKYSFKPKA
tara:strand:+ start:1258 stop:1512 length:255 start_codon:yes stop_codon:yes gene_type:complete